MPLFPKREISKETPREIPKEKPGGSPLFGDKKEISRREFRERLGRAPGRIPGTGKMYTRREMIGLEKGVFGKKYGSHISKPEYKKRLWELRKERYEAKTSAEKLKIGRTISKLKELGGFK